MFVPAPPLDLLTTLSLLVQYPYTVGYKAGGAESVRRLPLPLFGSARRASPRDTFRHGRLRPAIAGVWARSGSAFDLRAAPQDLQGGEWRAAREHPRIHGNRLLFY